MNKNTLSIRIIRITIILFTSIILFAQTAHSQVNIDSLMTVWNDTSQPDTIRLDAMNKIAWDGYLFSQPDSAFYFAQQEYDFAKSKGLKNKIADALNIQGSSFYIQDDYANAIDYYTRSLSIREEIGDKKGIAITLNNIGNIYAEQGDYASAIDFYTRSLAIMEEIGDKMGIASSLNNIGIIYKDQGDSADSTGNKALSADKYASAIDYYTRSLAIREKMGDKRGIASSLKNIGAIYNNQGDYSKAISYSNRALILAQEAGMAKETRNAAKVLYEAYKATNKHKPSLEMYELFIVSRDSINSEKNQKEVIRQKYKYDYDKKAIADSVTYIQVQKVQEAKLAKSKTQQYALIGGLTLLLAFLAYVYNRFRITQKQKLVISVQNKELATATELAESANSELKTKSNELEKFNNVMLDREMRIIELKKEANKLAKTNNTDIPYPEVEDD